jgi:hypothetical protein
MDRIKSIIRNVISPMQDGSVLIAYADYLVNKVMMDLYQVFHCESIDLEWSQAHGFKVVDLSMALLKDGRTCKRWGLVGGHRSL